MFETTIMTEKGQIVIKKALREKLKLKPGQKLIEEIEENKIILKPMPTLKELRDRVKIKESTDEIMKEIKKGWE
ncbi:MAG: AbrB/MazE/SpoVT family DNA-binding domain-containing protein [Candidatus Altiarchaeota archaeon]|nr:AbrB/MazE/SpoVT family DNA-binding domain-containing protein [Candidatus Altiarchaeota archaeon]